MVNDGLTIAAEIRSMGYTTIVLSDQECYSACALIWVAGVKRMMGETASIGIHAAWRNEAMHDGSTIATESGVANADIGSFLTNVGLSREAIRYFTTAGPQDVLPITPEIAQRLDIDTAVITDDGVVPASERPTPTLLVIQTANYLALGANCAEFYGLDKDWLRQKGEERLKYGHALFGGEVFAELVPMSVSKQKEDMDRIGVRAWCEDAEYQLRVSGLPTGVTGPSFDCAMRLALEQAVGATAAKAITEIFGTPATENERGWLGEIRDASDNTDPRLTARSRTMLRGIFGK